jgi:hypothetical protein
MPALAELQIGASRKATLSTMSGARERQQRSLRYDVEIVENTPRTRRYWIS